MSVLIKGVEMPTACKDCPMSTFTDFDTMPFCNITLDDMCFNDFVTKRMDNCPLVPVPPHGRLIDADALAETHRAMAEANGGRSYSFHTTAKAWVNEAPTVIEAEEGER